jgi:hypothetical protein
VRTSITVVRLVNRFNCLAYNWTVKDQWKVTWHKLPKKRIILESRSEMCKWSIKISGCCILIIPLFFDDTLSSNNIPFEVMSCNLSLIFDRPIICKTVKSIDQSLYKWRYSVGGNFIWWSITLTCHWLHKILINWLISLKKIRCLMPFHLFTYFFILNAECRILC